MQLNEQLKKARKENNFTQQEVANILNISRTTISSWEVGRTIPSLDYVIDLSDLYGISLDKLLKEDITIKNTIKKELKMKKIYKNFSLIAISILSLIILINLIWFINSNYQYKNVKDTFSKDTNGNYMLKKDGIDYFISKPGYLNFSNNKELIAKSNNIEWVYSITEGYGKTYLDFSNGGGSSFIINNNIELDETANEKIGLSFSPTEKDDINNYLKQNKDLFIELNKRSHSTWKDIQ